MDILKEIKDICGDNCEVAFESDRDWETYDNLQ